MQLPLPAPNIFTKSQEADNVKRIAMKDDIRTILVVEDDAHLQQILNEKLTQNGFNVIETGTVHQALTKINEEKIDLMLLDIMLPGGLNGFDLLEQIKAHSAHRDIPVIVLTNLETEKKTALDMGAVDYIVKTNISLDEVVLKIRNQLR